MLIQERLNESKAKRLDLESALSLSSTESASQEKARLLERVKEDNAEISGMERKINELEESMSKMKEKISQIDVDLESGSSEKNAKYEELLKRDKEMTAFLDKFEDKKTESLARNALTERTILDTMESIRVSFFELLITEGSLKS